MVIQFDRIRLGRPGYRDVRITPNTDDSWHLERHQTEIKKSLNKQAVSIFKLNWAEDLEYIKDYLVEYIIYISFWISENI